MELKISPRNTFSPCVLGKTIHVFSHHSRLAKFNNTCCKPNISLSYQNALYPISHSAFSFVSIGTWQNFSLVTPKLVRSRSFDISSSLQIVQQKTAVSIIFPELHLQNQSPMREKCADRELAHPLPTRSQISHRLFPSHPKRKIVQKERFYIIFNTALTTGRYENGS